MKLKWKIKVSRGIVVFACFLVLLFFSISSNNSGINYAKVIEPPQDLRGNNILNKCFDYNFYVTGKLIGSGEINLSIIEEKKITGTALGVGKANQYEIDFQTIVDGAIDLKDGEIDVLVSGIGAPVGILVPGKITYKGPLKGAVENKTLKLTGQITIKGRLAELAGFYEKETITIEIPDQSLVETIDKLQDKRKLASL